MIYVNFPCFFVYLTYYLVKKQMLYYKFVTALGKFFIILINLIIAQYNFFNLLNFILTIENELNILIKPEDH